MTIIISQSEADLLIKTSKHCLSDETYLFPKPGEMLNIPLISGDRRESFDLNVFRGRISLKKVSIQNRARKVIALVRIDLNPTTRHTNPDGEEISGAHMHIYREGYGDKWAYQLDGDIRIDSVESVLDYFMSYCNIGKRPNIQMGMF